MLITNVDEARRFRDVGGRAQLPFYFRHWACVIGLAAADTLSFAAAAVLFRVWRHEPTIFIHRNGEISAHATSADIFLPHGVPIDVFAVLGVLFICLRAFVGDYSRREPFWDGVRNTWAALLVIALPDLIAVTLSRTQYSLSGVVESWVFLLLAIPTMRQGARAALARMGLWQRCTALIGSGPATELAYGAFNKSLSLGFDIQWLLSIGSEVAAPGSLAKLKTMVSTNARDAGLLVQAAGCDQAILAMNDAEESAYPELVQRLSEANIETAIVPALARLPLGNLTTNVLIGRNILLFQVRDNLRRWPHRILKRAFDVVGAFFALIVLSPAFLVLAVLVKRQDGGPVMYSQVRVGREGRAFRCIKFRTMVRDADACLDRWRSENPDLYEEYQKAFKLRADPRITRLGNWLRRTSLDELPQLVNILRGEMSFVGPRPVVEQELLDYYGPAAQLYMRVRPGLTGLWQVSGRSDTTYEERIAFDEWYILNWSMWYDIIILAQTFGVMVSGYGAY
jgi:Undecaprenyl-phosphate galactose phosphotransferase WbaP